MTTATLGFAIDSSQAAGAASDLDRLSSAAAKVEQAAGRTGVAGTRMSRSFADINPSLEKIVGSLGRLEGITTSIDKRLNTMAATAGRASKANQVLDRSAIEASASYKQLEASLNAVTTAQKKGDASLATSLAAVEKQRAAIARLNAELQKLRAAPAPVPGGKPSPANNNNSGRLQNFGYQAFDVGQGLASGIPLQMIAAQQLPQIAQLYAGNGGVKAAIKDIGTLAAGAISAVGALPLAIGAATIAAVAFGAKFLDASNVAEKALEKHEETLKRIKGLFDNAGSASEQYGRRVQGSIDFSSRSDRTGLEEALTAQTTQAGTQLLSAAPRSSGAAFTRLYGPYLETVQNFIAETRKGKGDVQAFNDEITRIANDNPADTKIQKIAQRLLETTKAATETAQAIKDLNDEVARTTILTARTDAAAAAAKYQAGNTESLFQLQQTQGAALAGIGARSPQQIAAAARARVAAEPVNPNESPEVRQYREGAAAALALAQAEQQIKDAQRDRALNLGKIIDDQQNETSLIGKTGGAAAALRKEYELTSALRLEAARQGIDVDQKELDLIHQKAGELGKLTEAYNQSKFSFDINQQNSDARLSPRQRQIATTLRQYGLPEDQGGANAGSIGQQIDWQDRKDLFKGLFTNIEQEAWSNGGKIGKAIMTSIKNGFEKASEKALDSIFDKLASSAADWFTGSKGGASSGVGAVAGAVLGAANDNGGKAPIIPVTRAPLGDISSYAKAIKGLESSGNYGALGPVTKSGDRAYGAYQVMGANVPSWSKEALGKSMTASEFLTDEGAQDAVFKHKFGSYADKYGPAGAAQAWFGGPGSVGKGRNASDMLGTTGSQYVDKFTNALGDATKNIGTFGNGLGQIGQSLSSSFFPAAPQGGGGGGGIFSWLGGLFGGFKPNGAQATLAASGKITGMFANGTNYAPGGMAIVGEQGPELVDLNAGARVVSNNSMKNMMAANSNQNQRASAQPLNVHVYGANGDEHVMSLVQKGVSSALAEQNTEMRRTGFGDLQRRYANQKG